ncbi:MAG: hypothetical protein OER56_02640 [Hyphomicrobiales bacterium]|nr:hypothetical protein [Hyphomicrobiales bacterium]
MDDDDPEIEMLVDDVYFSSYGQTIFTRVTDATCRSFSSQLVE